MSARVLLVAAAVLVGLVAVAPTAPAKSFCVGNVVDHCGNAVFCLDHKDGPGWDVCVLEYHCPMGHGGHGCGPPYEP